MGSVALEGFGGGGASLNFDIKAYETEEQLLAASPKENTVGVVTADTITSWIFSATEPTEPVEGMVWIETGASSTVEFNALKKNGIRVCPLSTKQYVSGAWVDVTAKSFQNGVWVDWWNGELFDNGNGYDGITGGWGAYALKISDKVPESQYAPVIEILDDGSMKLTYGVSAGSSTYNGGVVRTNNKIKLSGYSKLRFTGYLYDTLPQYSYINLCIWSDIGTGWKSNIVASISGSASKNIATFPDVELSGLPDECYIGFGMYMNNAGSEILVKELKLIK